jgi:hypothetical protein
MPAPFNMDMRLAVTRRWTTTLGLAFLALSGTPVATAQELLSDPVFAAGPPAVTLNGWKVLGSVGGAVRLLDGTSTTVRLTPERVSLPDGGEAWQGTLIIPEKVEVVPGRRYRFQCEARGQGSFRLGLLEYGWKHSEMVIDTRHERATLTPEYRTLSGHGLIFRH